MNYCTEKNVSYSIRPAVIEDCDALRSIEIAAATRFADTGLIDDLENHMCPQRLAGLIDDGQVWVACADDRPVGFVVASVIDCGCLLEELDVIVEHAGRGLGRRLVEQVVMWALMNDHAFVYLSTFRNVPWNEPFYRKLGFTVVPEQEFTEDIYRLRENEKSAHLPLEHRVFMRLSAGA